MSFLSAPKPPNPEKVAAAQAKQNQVTIAANLAAARPDQITPTGSIKYRQTGVDSFGNPTWEATSALSSDQQALLDRLEQSQQGLGQIGGQLVSNLAGAGYGEVPDFGTAAGSLTNQMLSRQAAYMDPYYEQQNQNLDAKLRNQGLEPGTPAYDRAVRTLRQTQNESRGQFLNQAQNQAFQQAVQNYQIPLDTIQRIMGITGPAGINLANLPGVGQASSPDMANIYQQNYQNKLAQNNALWSGINSLVTGGMNLIDPDSGAGLSSMMGFA